MTSEPQCPACPRPVIAEIASADAAVNVADGYDICTVEPRSHDGMGFLYYIHDE